MMAALTSGLGWMLYKWLGRKPKAQRIAPDDGTEVKDNAAQARPLAD
jgi:hypothetical protein